MPIYLKLQLMPRPQNDSETRRHIPVPLALIPVRNRSPVGSASHLSAPCRFQMPEGSH